MATVKKGVDVSKWNGDVDFKVLKKNGISFVIIRCGYGSDFTYQDDEKFEANVKKAEAAGLPWGVYLYGHADTVAKAKSEAKHVLRLLKGRKPLYGVWYDAEDKSLPEDKKKLSELIVIFCEAMEAAGLYVGIYSMLSWMGTRLDLEMLAPYDKWIAQWNHTCDYQGSYGLWQFTDELKIGGKLFDGNYAYKDYPAIIKAMNAPEAPAAPEAPKPTKKTLAEVAEDVLKGVYGDGKSRRENLKKDGYDPDKVQDLVNDMMARYFIFAKAVVRGDYGDGETRKKRLRAKGFENWEISIIQNLVNELI